MPDNNFLAYLHSHWWLVALRGALAVLFGVFAWTWPGPTLLALVILWGAFAIADGVVALLMAWQVRDSGKPVWHLILVGVCGVLAGVLAFAWPGATAIVLLMLIAAWAIVTGVLEIVTAIRIRKEIRNEWLLGLAGALSIVFGVLMVANPGAGALALIAVIGLYAVLFGVLLIALGFRLRKMTHGTDHSRPAHAM
jgi:uncharacterized membrane protein HdeD (DUF308 family)